MKLPRPVWKRGRQRGKKEREGEKGREEGSPVAFSPFWRWERSSLRIAESQSGGPEHSRAEKRSRGRNAGKGRQREVEKEATEKGTSLFAEQQLQ